MTLKYNEGHKKWYEWVKLNQYYHHAKFDNYHTYTVRENLSVKVFAIYRQSAALTLIIKWTHIFHGVNKTMTARSQKT